MDCQSTWDCKADPNMEVDKGTEIILPGVWAHIEGGLTPSKDISIKLDKNQTLAEALCLVEAAAMSFVKEHGAKDIRHYFIENVLIEEGSIKFSWGT